MIRRPGGRTGLLLALAASGVSGVAVVLNGTAVHHVHATPTTYTTVKNLVAAVLLAGVVGGRVRGGDRRPSERGPSRGTWLGLAYVGVVGGGLAFALFFEGLARTSATSAAFTQKSLVVWVIAIAVPLLGERVGPAQWAAFTLLVVGAVALGAGPGGLEVGRGAALVLAATLLWAVEVVVAKRLLASVPALTVGTVRMAAGTVTLSAWLAASGQLGQIGHLGRSGWAWVLINGAVLALYVGLWLSALARARAVDVTAVLVSAAFVTAAISAGMRGAWAPHSWALVLVALGTAGAAAAWPRGRGIPGEAAPA